VRQFIAFLWDENTNAMSLSQGQKQRVLIARSLYRKNKSIYIFDEYLSAVDEKWSKEIHEYVLNYIKTNNKIGIFISHNVSQMYSTDKTVHL
jgi:ABC-type Mn2+/Zn2+ transport system ATPase subunit